MLARAVRATGGQPMMPDLDLYIDPDLQKMLAFLIPAIAAIAALTMNLSRGFSVGGKVFMVICACLALYFAPDFIETL